MGTCVEFEAQGRSERKPWKIGKSHRVGETKWV